jgi:hypothetical protein
MDYYKGQGDGKCLKQALSETAVRKIFVRV